MRIGGSRRNRTRTRNMRGGYDYIPTTNTMTTTSDNTSGFFNGVLDKLKNTYEDIKQKAVTTYDSLKNPETSTYIPTTIGGKRRKTRKTRKTRRMRGGFTDNTSLTGLAAHASPISGIKTAQPHNWVGGKTRRHRHRRSKSSRRR